MLSGVAEQASEAEKPLPPFLRKVANTTHNQQPTTHNQHNRVAACSFLPCCCYPRPPPPPPPAAAHTPTSTPPTHCTQILLGSSAAPPGAPTFVYRSERRYLPTYLTTYQPACKCYYYHILAKPNNLPPSLFDLLSTMPSSVCRSRAQRPAAAALHLLPALRHAFHLPDGPGRAYEPQGRHSRIINHLLGLVFTSGMGRRAKGQAVHI
jgi:hypothetical protein